MGMHATPAELADWQRRGLIPAEPAERASCSRRPPLLAQRSLVITVVVPLVTKSEANQRSWHGRLKRSQAARAAWAACVGLPWGGLLPGGLLPCRVHLTRLGGRRLDGHDNLPISLKYVVDAIAAWLGCDDADPRVSWSCGQEPGKAYGVRVEIRQAEGGET